MKCVLCGKEVENEEDLTKDICEDCMKDYFTERNAIKIGDKNTNVFSINEFLLFAIDNDMVNNILTDYILKHRYYGQDDKTKIYLKEHLTELAEMILKGEAE